MANVLLNLSDSLSQLLGDGLASERFHVEVVSSSREDEKCYQGHLRPTRLKHADRTKMIRLVLQMNKCHPCQAKYILGNITCLTFLSSFNIEMMQEVEIMARGGQLFVLHSQCLVLKCPGNTRSQGISSHDNVVSCNVLVLAPEWLIHWPQDEIVKILQMWFSK